MMQLKLYLLNRSKFQVGTWSLDQTLLWTPNTNATTGEMRDQSDLGLTGAQLELIKAVQSTGKPVIVVYVTGKPIAEPWVKDREFQVCQTWECWPHSNRCGWHYSSVLSWRIWRYEFLMISFFPVLTNFEGRAIAEVIFGDVNPSGKLSLSVPRDVGTTPVFHNYLKGGRPASNPGLILDDGTLRFGNQVSSVMLAFPLVSDVCSVCTQQPGTPLELRSWPKLYNFSIVCSFISSMFVLNINI